MSSSTESDEKPEFRKGHRVAGWTIIRRIGRGGFGTVYEVEKDGQHAAMKTEYVFKGKSESLRNEVKQLRLLQFSQHFCCLFLACKSSYDCHAINVMVMTLVDRSLSSYRHSTPHNKFTRSTAFRLARQSLQALKDMHSVGIIHRDVKAGNFAWCSLRRLVILLDLGFCRRIIYVTEMGQTYHHKPRKELNFMGTTKYCSINMHNRQEQSRRDDLWSWLYMFVEFVRGKLVWSERGEHITAVLKTKIGSKLLSSCPTQMVAIFDHIGALKFSSKPDYELLRKKMEEYMTEKRIQETEPYDWEVGGVHHDYILERQRKEAKANRPKDDLLDQEPRIKEMSWATLEKTATSPPVTGTEAIWQ